MGVYQRPPRDSHPDDCSIMSYRGHTVLRTLIRCHFSPAETTGSQYIYSGSADGVLHVRFMRFLLKASSLTSPIPRYGQWTVTLFKGSTRAGRCTLLPRPLDQSPSSIRMKYLGRWGRVLCGTYPGTLNNPCLCPVRGEIDSGRAMFLGMSGKALASLVGSSKIGWRRLNESVLKAYRPVMTGRSTIYSSSLSERSRCCTRTS